MRPLLHLLINQHSWVHCPSEYAESSGSGKWLIHILGWIYYGVVGEGPWHSGLEAATLERTRDLLRSVCMRAGGEVESVHLMMYLRWAVAELQRREGGWQAWSSAATSPAGSEA